MTDKRHPLEVTADRLAQHRKDFHGLLSDAERRDMDRLEVKFRRLGALNVGKRQAWRPSIPVPGGHSGIDDVQRPAEPGELCTCGRQATVVYGSIGACRIDDGGRGGPELCPFCRGEIKHPRGDKCPRYTLRPA